MKQIIQMNQLLVSTVYPVMWHVC